MKLFGMISTQHSRHYTYMALKTFFEHTALSANDRFILIDNDGSLEGQLPLEKARLELLSNQAPQSFAQNVNMVLQAASASKADVYFLNNDLIFTPDWLTPLLVNEPSILSPLSNREVQHKLGNLDLRPTMDLPDYFGREEQFEEFLNNIGSTASAVETLHRSKSSGYLKVLSLPFFCVKLPFEVYSQVGLLDESFLVGGGEDNDYCVRAYLKGFEVKYACASFVLHFIGKSTWSGGETSTQTKKRVDGFIEVFENKWGKDLLDILIHNKLSALDKTPEIKRLANEREFKSLIEALTPNRIN